MVVRFDFRGAGDGSAGKKHDASWTVNIIIFISFFLPRSQKILFTRGNMREWRFS